MRKTHRTVGVLVAVFVLSSAITGLFWAYGPFTYWKSGYLERKHPLLKPGLETIRLTPTQAVAASGALPERLNTVTLQALPNRWTYEVQWEDQGKKKTALVDARKGNVLSPLSSEQALEIARLYVLGEPALDRIEEQTPYKHRKGTLYDSAYRVCFVAKGSPEIFVDRYSGEVIEDQDSSRRFHFFIMRLHQLNFFGFKKTLTAIPGLGAIFLTITGLLIAYRMRRQRRGVDKG